MYARELAHDIRAAQTQTRSRTSSFPSSICACGESIMPHRRKERWRLLRVHVAFDDFTCRLQETRTRRSRQPARAASAAAANLASPENRRRKCPAAGNATGRLATNAHRGRVQTNEGRLIFVAETIKDIDRQHLRLSRRLTVETQECRSTSGGLSPTHLAASEVVRVPAGRIASRASELTCVGTSSSCLLNSKALGSLAQGAITTDDCDRVYAVF